MGTHDNRSSPGQQAPQSSGGGAAQLGPGSMVGGSWIVERLLGKGGMGAVWLVRHQRLANKRAAIKVLHGTGLSDEAYIRFAREAEISTRIGHPNIVDVLDLAALETGEPYIVLEYLQGETLRDRLRRERQLSFAVTAELTRQIGSALLAAHRHEVVHRDLKPENVFVVPTDSGGVIRSQIKVLDFGISKLRGSQTLQTQEAVLLGTPQYMAPEQASGQNHAVDGRTDQFALAVMVYEMLTGQPPWVADTPLGLLYQVVHAPTPQFANRLPEVPPSAILAIEKALSKDAGQRFGDIGAFVQALTGTALQTLDGQSGAVLPAAKPQDVKIIHASQGAGALDASTRREMEEPTWDGVALPDLATDQTAAGDLRTPIGLQAPPAMLATAPVPAALLAPAPSAAPAAPAAAAVAPAAAPPSRRSPAIWAVGAGAAVAIAAGAWWATRGNGRDATPAAATAAAPSTINPESASGDAKALGPHIAPDPHTAASGAPAPAVAQPAAPAAAATATALKTGPVPAGGLPGDPAKQQPQDQGDAKALGVPKAGAAVAPADRRSPGDPPRLAPAGVTPEEVAEAEAALAAGKLAEAARLATHSLLERKTARALAVLTIVQCKRGDLGGAKTWFGQISGGAKAAARKACLAEGVEL